MPQQAQGVFVAADVGGHKAAAAFGKVGGVVALLLAQQLTHPRLADEHRGLVLCGIYVGLLGWPSLARTPYCRNSVGDQSRLVGREDGEGGVGLSTEAVDQYADFLSCVFGRI